MSTERWETMKSNTDPRLRHVVMLPCYDNCVVYGFRARWFIHLLAEVLVNVVAQQRRITPHVTVPVLQAELKKHPKITEGKTNMDIGILAKC